MPSTVNNCSGSSYKCKWPWNASNISARADIKQLLDIGGFEMQCQYCHWVQAIVSSWWPSVRVFSTLLEHFWEIQPVRKLWHTDGKYFKDFLIFLWSKLYQTIERIIPWTNKSTTMTIIIGLCFWNHLFVFSQDWHQLRIQALLGTKINVNICCAFICYVFQEFLCSSYLGDGWKLGAW